MNDGAFQRVRKDAKRGHQIACKSWIDGVNQYQGEVNNDASVDIDNLRYGINVIIRDEHGKVMASRPCLRKGIGSIYVAELWAIRNRLMFTWEQGYRSIIFKSNAEVYYNCKVLLQEIWGIAF